VSKETLKLVVLKKPGVYCEIMVPSELARIGKYLKPRDMVDVPTYEPWVVYEIKGNDVLLSDAIMLNLPHLNDSEIKEVQ
jgi:hypothetical protein